MDPGNQSDLLRAQQQAPRSSNIPTTVPRKPHVRRCGLSNKEALTKLYDDMSQEVDRMKVKYDQSNSKASDDQMEFYLIIYFYRLSKM